MTAGASEHLDYMRPRTTSSSPVRSSGSRGRGRLDHPEADLGDARAKQVIVAGIIAVAEALGITVLAEGVETEREARVLLEAGIPIQQGYYFAKPAIASLPPVPVLGRLSDALAA